MPTFIQAQISTLVRVEDSENYTETQRTVQTALNSMQEQAALLGGDWEVSMQTKRQAPTPQAPTISEAPQDVG